MVEDKQKTLEAMKLSLVLCDYENWNQAASKAMDWIQKLRSLEIAFVSAFYLILITKQDTNPLFVAFSLFLIIGMFMLTEGIVTADLQMINQIMLDLEKKFSCTDLDGFNRELLTWTFSTTLYMKEKPRSFKARVCQTSKALLRITLLMWHGTLIFTVVLFCIIRYCL